MPISPIVLQRRHAELGRIRLGHKVGDGRGRPAKLASFRFTSPSERYIHDLATLYGGEPRPWDNNGKPEFEVFTDAKSIPVIAVKGGLSQWMETWSGGGCTHRCTGERDVEGNICNPDDPAHQNAKPTTRLSVMLPELEAIGVWRMESHGWNAAAEIPAVAELAQFVGDLVPANLHLVERRSVKDGQTSRFVVPVLDLQIGTARLKEIVAAKSGGVELEAGQGQQAVGGQQERQAITTGADPYADLFAEVEAATTLEELAGIWDHGNQQGLLGPKSQATPRRAEFTAAWKNKAHQIKDAMEAQAGAEEPVDAELVGDDGGPDADEVWRQILEVAGTIPLTETQLRKDFAAKAGVSPEQASAGELAAYLAGLRKQAGVAA